MGKVCGAAPQDDGRPLSKSLRHSQPLNELAAQGQPSTMVAPWPWLLLALRCAGGNPRPKKDPFGCDELLPESSDAVALVVRGESFRGLNAGAFVQLEGYDTHALRSAIICTESSWEIQRALARNQVALLVEPLERRGVRVDVYLSSYGCWGVPGVANATAARWWRDLESWYGGPRRVRFSAPIAKAPGQTQRTPIDVGVGAALAAGAAYRSVFVWRFDLALLDPVAAADASATLGSAAPTDYLATDRAAPRGKATPCRPRVATQ